MLPGAGDELQGIKKGVIELADMIAVNKADGDNIPRAKAAAAEYRAALHILKPASANWSPPVVTYSAMTGDGLTAIWQSICDYRDMSTKFGELVAKRRSQQVAWMWSMLEERLFAKLRSDPELKSRLPQIEKQVAAGKLSPMLAVEEIAGAMGL
jgi:LAO/AO transport system kinase